MGSPHLPSQQARLPPLTATSGSCGQGGEVPPYPTPRGSPRAETLSDYSELPPTRSCPQVRGGGAPLSCHTNPVTPRLRGWAAWTGLWPLSGGSSRHCSARVVPPLMTLWQGGDGGSLAGQQPERLPRKPQHPGRPEVCPRTARGTRLASGDPQRTAPAQDTRREALASPCPAGSAGAAARGREAPRGPGAGSPRPRAPAGLAL